LNPEQESVASGPGSLLLLLFWACQL